MADFDRFGDKSRLVTDTVNSGTIVWDDVVVPPGETWHIRGVEAFCPELDGSNVALFWDRDGTPEPLFIAYGSDRGIVDQEVVGDGVKKLSVRFQNRTLLNGVEFSCRYYAGKTNG